MSNIDEEKGWNLKDGITKLAEELFMEKFRDLSTGEPSNLENKEFLLEYIEKIRSVSSSFEKQLLDCGKRAEKLFSEFDCTRSFYRKGQECPVL